MNYLVLISGIFATLTTAGHFLIGRKWYLLPMLEASFDPVAKKVIHAVFHYVSVFLITSSAALLLAGLGLQQPSDTLVKYIALNYALFALWQLGLAFASDIPRAPLKMFQWVFFILIAAFAWLGT